MRQVFDKEFIKTDKINFRSFYNQLSKILKDKYGSKKDILITKSGRQAFQILLRNYHFLKIVKL